MKLYTKQQTRRDENTREDELVREDGKRQSKRRDQELHLQRRQKLAARSA